MYQGSGTIRSNNLKCTCSACPSQFEGTLSDGRILYIRFRHSRFAIYVSKEAIVDWTFDDMDLIHEEYIGDGLDGYMPKFEVLDKLIVHGNGILKTTFFERVLIKSKVILEPFICKLTRKFYDLYYKTPMGKRAIRKQTEALENLFKNRNKGENVQD